MKSESEKEVMIMPSADDVGAWLWKEVSLPSQH